MTPASAIPAEFARQYEAERARVLRRRAVIYCKVVIGLILFSVAATVWDLFLPYTGDSRVEQVVGLVFDGMYLFVHFGAIALLKRDPPSRQRVITIMTWLIFVIGSTTIISTPVTDNTVFVPNATTVPTPEAAFAQGIANLLYLFIIHMIVSMLVNLSPWEGLRPMVPLLGMFAITVFVVRGSTFEDNVKLVLLSPLCVVPGLLWSWWRHRSFFTRFYSRALEKRYAEVSRDLDSARRVHEFLFPKAIEDGPVRMTYRYEPAQHIGGDFLFAKRLVLQGGREVLALVVLDVTGHGIPAALAVNRIHGELSRMFVHGQPVSPAQVIDRLNAFAVESLAPQGMFASAVCVMVEPSGNGAEVKWSSAGHPDVLLRHANDVQPLRSTTCMLGVLEGDLFAPGEGWATMNAGDAIIALTDGVHDSAGPSGTRLTSLGTQQLVQSLPLKHSLCEQMMAKLESWRTGPAVDDTLIVEVRLAEH